VRYNPYGIKGLITGGTNGRTDMPLANGLIIKDNDEGAELRTYRFVLYTYAVNMPTAVTLGYKMCAHGDKHRTV